MVNSALSGSPAVALLHGGRVGNTTLAEEVTSIWASRTITVDLGVAAVRELGQTP